MGSVTLKLEPCSAVVRPTGVVAQVRMPIPLKALEPLNAFVAAAYGPDCVCQEDPPGWLTVTTQKKEVEK